MKSAYVLDYVGDTPFQELALEVAFKWAREGYAVTFVQLGILLPQTEFGLNGKGSGLGFRARLVFVARQLVRYLKVRLVCHRRIREEALAFKFKMPFSFRKPRSLAVASWKLWDSSSLADETSIGVKSSMVNALLDSKPQLTPLTKRMSKQFSDASMLASEWLLRESRNARIDLIGLYNGRFAVPMEVANTAKGVGIQVKFFDNLGPESGRYFLHDFRPHNVVKLGKEIRRSFAPELPSSRTDQVVKYFDGFASIPGQDGHEFTKTQTSFFQPPDLRDSRNGILTFFTSSDDEFVEVLDKTSKGIFSDQFEAISWLADQSRLLGFKLVIRVHPRVSRLSAREQERWNENLPSCLPESVSFIRSDDDIQSYSLLKQSSIVIVWHSTIGAQAILSGVPTICLAYNLYEECGAETVRVRSRAELMKALSSGELQRPNADSLSTYVYGMTDFGEPQILMRRVGLLDCEFMGRNLAKLSLIGAVISRISRRWLQS